MSHPTLSTVALVCLAGLAGGPAPAADTLLGTASLNEQKVRFTHGLGTWKAAKREVSLGFFTSTSSAADGPHVVLDLTFEEGATKAAVDGVAGCHIGLYKFKDGPLDYNGFASQCGIAELSGDLRPGGVVSGKLKGESLFKGFASLPTKAASWDLSFMATLRATESSVEAEVAVGSKAAKLGPGGGAPGRAFLEQKCKPAPDLKDRKAAEKYLEKEGLLPSKEDLAEMSKAKGRPVKREEAIEMAVKMLELGAAMGLRDCKILGGSEGQGTAVLEIEATTMGERMRNDFTLMKDGQGWKVHKEGAWRAARAPAPDAPSRPEAKVSAAPEPPAAYPAEAVKVGGAIREPKLLMRVAPVVPSGVPGTAARKVVLECLVSSGGRVVQVRVKQGDAALAAAATKALRQWVYQTTLVNGVPTPVILDVTLEMKP